MCLSGRVCGTHMGAAGPGPGLLAQAAWHMCGPSVLNEVDHAIAGQNAQPLAEQISTLGARRQVGAVTLKRKPAPNPSNNCELNWAHDSN